MECARCGKPEDHMKHALEFENGTIVCDECFTDEEQDESFRIAHYLTTGHYPDSPECHCGEDNAWDIEW